MDPTIEYRKALQMVRTGKTTDFVNLIVGGTKKTTLPRVILQFMPFFVELLSEKPNVGGTHYFVPFLYGKFNSLVEFMFNPDLCLSEEHYSTWRFFFRVNNVSDANMASIPQLLRIPVQYIIIVPKRGNWYNSKKYGLDHLFATSNYFRALFANSTVNNFRIDLDENDDPLVLILNKAWYPLSVEYTISEVKEVMAKFGVTLDTCLMCNSIDYCKCRGIYRNCFCGFPISEKCGVNPEGKKCEHCETIHYSHNYSPNCSEHQCEAENCVNCKVLIECGLCKYHCSRGISNGKYSPCKKHHCQRVSRNGSKCLENTPCPMHD